MVNHETQDTDANQFPPEFPIDSALLLGVVTGPFLGTMMLLQKASGILVAWGQASEEIFRGDRLPILPNPEMPTPANHHTQSQESE